MPVSPLINRDFEARLFRVENQLVSTMESVEEHKRILVTGHDGVLPLPEKVRNVENWQRNFDKYAFIVIALLLTIVAQNAYQMYIKFASLQLGP